MEGVAQNPQFFFDPKRGEINELRQLLISARNDRYDHSRQRETIKKVIALMTIGIDVSRLFSEMVMACCTTDIVQKKMIYMYLGTYAETNQHLSLLAVNTLQKDCVDHDPTVRGLALKSLCSFKTLNVFEYLEPAVRQGLCDSSEYVRRIAVMGVLRIFHISPETVIGERGFPPMDTEDDVYQLYTIPSNPSQESLLRILFALLNDIHPQVVCNAICVLNEILSEHGGIPMIRSLIVRLLNRIKQFHDTSQCIILNLLSQYEPSNENEVYDIMNILESQLRHPSPSILLATTRCFLCLLKFCPQNLPCELSYVVLLHLKHILLRFENEPPSCENSISVAAEIFKDDYKLFFCPFTDPSYLKSVKIELLVTIVAETTAPSILDELAEYVVIDPDESIVRQSVKAMGEVVFKFPVFRESVTEQLIRFMKLDHDPITSSSFIVLREFVAEEPHLFEKFASEFQRKIVSIKDPKGLSACLWMLGQRGTTLPLSPYLLEDILDILFPKSQTKKDRTLSQTPGYLSLEDTRELKTDHVIFELVTAALRLLLHRAPEVHHTAGKLFSLLLDDDDISFDARDRVLFLYRFLREASTNPKQLFPVLQFVLSRSCDSTYISKIKQIHYSDDVAKSLSPISEFNTLSLIFDRATQRFLTVQNRIPFNGRFITPRASPDAEAPHTPSPTVSTNLLSPHSSVACESTNFTHEGVDQFNDNNVKDTCDTVQNMSPVSDAFHNEPTAELLDYQTNIPIALQFEKNAKGCYDAASFEALWNRIPTSQTFSNDAVACDFVLVVSQKKILDMIRENFVQNDFHCIASGSPTPGHCKWFTYGICVSPRRVVILLEVQLVLLQDTKQFSVEMKIEPPNALHIESIITHLKQSGTFLSLLIASTS